MFCFDLVLIDAEGIARVLVISADQSPSRWLLRTTEAQLRDGAQLEI